MPQVGAGSGCTGADRWARAQSCWLIIFGEVYDFTDLICESRGTNVAIATTRGRREEAADPAVPAGPEVELLIANAGRDVSHWFDRETGDVRSLGRRLASVRGRARLTAPMRAGAVARPPRVQHPSALPAAREVPPRAADGPVE